MFARMREDHLVPLYKARELFKSALTQRVAIYEERLNKPWYERGTEYIKTGYGEEGYKRTKDFLADISDTSICSTEDLINLTRKEKYRQGNTLPLLLQSNVLEICKFNINHIYLVEDDLRAEILAEGTSKYAVIQLLTLRNQAIRFIYDKIINSDDYGHDYLSDLNHQLLKNTSATKELPTIAKNT